MVRRGQEWESEGRYGRLELAARKLAAVTGDWKVRDSIVVLAGDEKRAVAEAQRKAYPCGKESSK